MSPFLSTRAALLVLVNTILMTSLLPAPAHSFPLEIVRFSGATGRNEPQVAHFHVRTAGPTHAGIITHPPAQLHQAIFGNGKPEPDHLPQSGLYTRGNLAKSVQESLDRFIVQNDKHASFYYTLSILGLGINNRPDGLYKFFLSIDLAVSDLQDARGHTKLPQLTVKFFAPHPNDENSMIVGDLMDIYELTEDDILETIETDEPAVNVMRFLSSRVSRMPGFVHKHVGVEEFELLVARTTDKSAAGHP
ncbi:hypothetical protein TWF694_001002 [Orbilia ellipsospora]|uniref:Uncharacterized protein n=1 Tax=Orbilia ellipsospora TaxID=2528407 RepID=A0AAV9XRY3_9PEZI